MVALLTTPFDVVSRRMQMGPTDAPFRNSADAVVKIVRHEGPLTLWRGIAPSLMMTVPATAFYFTFYQALRGRVEQQELRFVPSWASPLVAAPVARTATVLMSAPLELVRTRLQASAASGGRESTMQIMRDVVRSSGASGLFRGVWPTLWRDVPFSMLYWFLYEQSVSLYSRWADRSNALYCYRFGDNDGALGHGGGDFWQCSRVHSALPSSVHFVAGAFSGSVAATVTHPIEILKTRRQMGSPLGALALAGVIWRSDGAAGFTRGMAARVLKVSPASAIMIGSFEWFLKGFERRRNAAGAAPNN